MSDTPGDSRGGRWVVALATATLPSLMIYQNPPCNYRAEFYPPYSR